MEDNNNKFGKLLTDLRTKKNMTQKELADQLMVSDKTVSRWENGGSLPDMDMVHDIAKFFKLSINDLAILKVASRDGNEEIVQDMIKEFSLKDKQKKRIIRMLLIIGLSIITILSAAFIFSQSYNRFKVYSVIIKSNDMYPRYGMYVETKIKDTLYLNTIALRNYTPKVTDTVSVDLYYLDNNEEKLLHSYNSLSDIKFVDQESYIKINNLSDYFDNLYVKVTIIDDKNKEKVYTGKLEFTLDFSNNKIYSNDKKTVNNSSIKFTPEEIKEILLKNGYEEIAGDYLYKYGTSYSVNYNFLSNKFNYKYKINNMNYRIIYDINNSILTVGIFDENNVEIENYTYDVTNNMVIECVTGKCNNYDEAMKKLNDDVLYLLY